MGAFVPGIHAIQQLVRLVNDIHRAFDALGQMGIGHHDGNLYDPVMFGVKTGHFTVKPDQILIRFSKQGAGAGGVGAVHGPELSPMP